MPRLAWPPLRPLLVGHVQLTISQHKVWWQRGDLFYLHCRCWRNLTGAWVEGFALPSSVEQQRLVAPVLRTQETRVNVLLIVSRADDCELFFASD